MSGYRHEFVDQNGVALALNHAGRLEVLIAKPDKWVYATPAGEFGGYEADLAREILRLAEREHEHERFAAELIGLLGLDREYMDRNSIEIGNSLVVEIRGRLRSAEGMAERVRELEDDAKVREERLRLVEASEVQIADDALRSVFERDRRIAVLEEETARLTRWLQAIEGGGNPIDDASRLRQMAYNALTLRREAPDA